MPTYLTVKKNLSSLQTAVLTILTEKHLDKILHLQQAVYEDLSDKQLFIPSSREEILQALQQSSHYVLGFTTQEDGLIALGIYKDVGQTKSNYGYDYGLRGDKLSQIAHVDTTLVAAPFRGNHLQKHLIEEMIAIALLENKCYLCCTVSPYNLPSLHTFLKMGFQVKADCLKYGGVRRYVMEKKLI